MGIFSIPANAEEAAVSYTHLDVYKRQDLVKAYSKASVATVFLDTWEKSLEGENLPATTYDTVRDITQNFKLTSELDHRDASWASDGTKSTLYGQERYIATVNQWDDGTWYVGLSSPGIEWLTVTCRAGAAGQEQYGSRRLRVIPTSNLNAGNPEDVVSPGGYYDHADDVQLAYSTGPRMAVNMADITTGIYPDQPHSFINNGDWSQQQKDTEPHLDEQYLKDGDDKFYDVDVSHIAEKSKIAKVEIARVSSIQTGGEVETEPPLNLKDKAWADKWNGKSVFAIEDQGRYILNYYWELSDGRYLSDEKIISVVEAEHTLTVKVEDTKGNPVDGYLYLGAAKGNSASVDMTSPAGETKLEGIRHEQEQGSASWQKAFTEADVVGLKVEMEGLGETYSSETIQNPVNGSKVTVPVQYIKYLGNLIRGDLGTSFLYTGRPVADVIFSRLGPSVLIGIQAVLLGLAVGLTLGIIAAWKHNSGIDYFTMVLSLIHI